VWNYVSNITGKTQIEGENRVQRRIFVPKRDVVTGGYIKLHKRNVIICNFVGWLNQWEWNGHGMYHSVILTWPTAPPPKGKATQSGCVKHSHTSAHMLGLHGEEGPNTMQNSLFTNHPIIRQHIIWAIKNQDWSLYVMSCYVSRVYVKSLLL
jgi:hypothetical protein